MYTYVHMILSLYIYIHLFFLGSQITQNSNDGLQEACLRGDLGLVKRLIAANASVTWMAGGDERTIFKLQKDEQDGLV